jgi:hypothetical protein
MSVTANILQSSSAIWLMLAARAQAGYGRGRQNQLDGSYASDVAHQTVLDTAASSTTSAGDSDTVVIQPCERVDGEVDSNVEVARLPRHGAS